MGKLVRALSEDGSVLCSAIDTTDIVREIERLHQPTPVVTAALGRMCTAGAIMGALLKNEGDTLTLRINGGGPCGTLTVVADYRGNVKCCAGNAKAAVPLRSDGGLDVSACVGRDGNLTVVKDMGLKEPYVGTIELVSGELGIDFAQYFTVSEQQPSLVSLGVLVNGDVVLKAGGLLVQPMPGCEEETIEQLELRSPMFADISREMTEAPKEQLLEDWFRGMKPVVLDRTLLRYHCGCSRARMEKALISLGRKELQTIIDEDTGAELGCHFCHQQYHFTTEELKQLLEKATRE